VYGAFVALAKGATCLPGVDGLLDAERDAAHGHLIIAENLAGVSATHAYTALCFMFSSAYF
jgi:hypothetical protein